MFAVLRRKMLKSSTGSIRWRLLFGVGAVASGADMVA